MTNQTPATPVTEEKTLSIVDSAELKAARVTEQMKKAEAIIPSGAAGPTPMTRPADGISEREMVQFRQNSINFAVAYFQNSTDEQKGEFYLTAFAEKITQFIVNGPLTK